MDKRYDFDLIIPEEEFKKNQKREKEKNIGNKK